MRYVKRYDELFENKRTLTDEQKEFLDKHTRGSWTLNPTTGLVDVAGGFNCSEGGLNDLLGIEFGVVSGSFFCSKNQLTSLKGAPLEVGGDFFCHANKLTSLDGAPRKVGESFACQRNQLTSLEGGPEWVGFGFLCSCNQLTSLKGAPREVSGGFFCTDNKLTSLEGAPEKVGGNFDCSDNRLTSLEGAPREVGDDFLCANNKFASLKGEPERVGGFFYPSFDGGFKWNIKGKFECMETYPEGIPLILPTITYESLIKEVPESPTLLKLIEDFDKNLYNKLLKDLGWDKMGPDLLRQLKDGIV